MGSNLRQGDLVWARVVYPHKWWPGFLLKTDFLGCLVSFFGLQDSRYFLPSEICSFERHFKLHIHTCTCPTSNLLLDRAFKILGHKVAFDLQFPDRSENPRPSNLFRPRQVLKFVRSIAVSAWVEDVDFVSAVNVLAQITVFRHHLVNSSLSVLGMYSGVHSRVEADQHLSEMMHSVDEDLDNSGMEENCHVRTEDEVLSEQVEKNFPASLVDRNTTSNLFLEECLSPPIQSRHCNTQSLPEMLVKQDVPALNQFGLDGGCLNTLHRSVLSFRNLSCQTTFDIIIKKCLLLERGEPQSFNTGCIDSLLAVKFLETVREKTILPCLTSMEYPVKCVGLKRQLDQSLFAEPTLKLRKTLLFSINGADAYMWRSGKDHNDISVDTFSSPSEVHKTMTSFYKGAYAYLDGNMTGCIADLFFRSEAKFRTPNVSCIAAQSSTHICSSSLMDFVGNMLNFPILEHRSPKVWKLVENEYSLDNSGTLTSYANRQQPEQCEAILKGDGTFIYDVHDATEKILRPSDSQSLSNFEPGGCTDDDVGSRTRNEHEMPPVDGDNSISIKISGGRNKNVENRELVQSVTSESASKSPEGQQSEVKLTSAFSKSLFIKFPMKYCLPSKEELVKKFSPFGIVDSFSTKVYFYTGTARVVFLHQLDAVAAYQYAKRKKIFGEENVRYWLDPIEHKRGTKYPVRLPSLTAKQPEFELKSCLKKSKSLTKEDKGRPQKVRFTIKT